MAIGRRLIALGGLVIIVGTAFGVLSLVGLIGRQGGGPGIENAVVLDPPAVPGKPELGVGAEPGKLAPGFEISDFEGNRRRLSEFRGDVVYVNFWATWCIPCQIEMPDIQELLDRHNEELVVITVNRGERLGTARRFLENLPRNDGGIGTDFAVNGMDPDDTLYNEYRGLGMPLSVFIDANGVVTEVRNGLMLLSEMEEALAEALRSSEAGG